MSFPSLEQYASGLPFAPRADTRIWRDAQGRAQGRYFNSTLTSAFQPLLSLDSGKVCGFEGFARSYSASDDGLSLWRLLDHAASDEESIALDRLCRMLHAINFFRQPAAAERDLYLSVHARLLAAVDSNHGIAFGRILHALGLPQERIVLQLPAIAEHQGWLLNYVADNYRRNGFRIAVNAASVQQAIGLLHVMRPQVVKLDASACEDNGLPALLDACAAHGTQAVFKRVEQERTVDMLRRAGERCGQAILAQGYFWSLPKASLEPDVHGGMERVAPALSNAGAA